MIRPCNITLNGCPGSDSPITNLSSEAPDPLLFAGIGWSQYNPYAIPPLGDGQYISRDCFNLTYSADSQELADLFAQINAAICSGPTPGGGSPIPPSVPPFAEPLGAGGSPVPPPIPGVVYQQFTNTAQTATVSCPNGAVFTYTVPAGFILSGPMPVELGPTWVELANAWAMSLALQTVWSLRVCISVPLIDLRRPPGPNPPSNWPPGVAWPPIFPQPPDSQPPVDWPPGTPWPLPTANGATIAANPGWCCANSPLDPGLNTYELTGGTEAFTFSISGNIPPGTGLIQTDPRTAHLSGIPTTPGVYTYSITAVQDNNSGVSVVVTDTLKVFGLTTLSLPKGSLSAPYPAGTQLQSAGGTNPITFQVIAGALPPGLSLSSNGTITGTPTLIGTYSFAVQFTDAEGGACSQELTIDIGCPDWTTLIWGTPTPASVVNGGFSPLAGASDSFSSFENGGAAQSFNTATIFYNGPACNCNFHLTLISGTLPGPVCAMSLFRVSPFSVLCCANALAPGAYDFPFTMPDTLGATVEFQVIVHPPDSGGPFTWTGLFQNSP